MKKRSTSFLGVSRLIIIALTVLASSCNGQAYKNDAESTLPHVQPGKNFSILERNPSKEWISEVVRMMFQDSRGNIGFGTQNGAFKLTGKTLTHIDSIISESGKDVTIKDITEGKDGTIWLGHTDGISSVQGWHSNQHHLYTYDGNELLAFEKSADNKGPVVFQIYKDQEKRLWFVGYGGAYRLENGKFLNITKDGPW